MKKDSKYGRILSAVNHYFVFFLLVAFLITCCMMLFVSTLSRTLGITFTDEHIGDAAKLTFANVVLLSVLFAVIDMIRRKISVKRPVRIIAEAAERIMNGDFSVRIKPFGGFLGDAGFNPVVECFNRMAEELSSTEVLRTDFIVNVSHELKTPLAVIGNYSTMLQDPMLGENERIQYAKSICAASQGLAELVTNILKLNKLENQQIFPTAEAYDLSEQLYECLLQFESVWEQKNINIDTDIEDGVTVCADAELLSLVWNNLFSNAFKFTENGGEVKVSLLSDEKYTTVRVTDTGCGITPEVGEHIFEKFYQGDASHASKGNGLGLALVKRVVDIMHAEITVESVKGQGSTFTVKIMRG